MAVALGAAAAALWMIWLGDVIGASPNEDLGSLAVLLGGAALVGGLPILLVTMFGHFHGARQTAAQLLAVAAVLTCGLNIIFCLLGIASQDYMAFLGDMYLGLLAGWIFTATAIVGMRAARRMGPEPELPMSVATI